MIRRVCNQAATVHMEFPWHKLPKRCISFRVGGAETWLSSPETQDLGKELGRFESRSKRREIEASSCNMRTWPQANIQMWRVVQSRRPITPAAQGAASGIHKQPRIPSSGDVWHWRESKWAYETSGRYVLFALGIPRSSAVPKIVISDKQLRDNSPC